MREIKFRGYELDTQEWLYGGYHKHITCEGSPWDGVEEQERFLDEHTEHIMIVDGFADWGMPKRVEAHGNIDPKSVGQFTGMKDIKRKEIYEGDLVKLVLEIPTSSENEKNNGKIGTIKFLEYGFCVFFEEDNIIDLMTIQEIGNLEIVGNYYEEELEAKK